jgi:uncharacterized protein (TIGR00304 family)
MEAETLSGFGVALLFAGIIVTFVAVVLLLISNVRKYKKGSGKVKGGGAVIIGPFPIVFGTDEESTKTVLLLSLALTVVLAIASVIFYLLSR